MWENDFLERLDENWRESRDFWENLFGGQLHRNSVNFLSVSSAGE